MPICSGKRARISDPILKTFETAKLRGMGGAGFPTFRKWTTVRDCRGDEKYTICNGDESEPGTFKDRELLRRAPHLVIEGITLAGLVTGAARGWIFIRHEYQEEIAAVRRSTCRGASGWALSARGFSAPRFRIELEVFVSPGGYICGEETALLEAMEDRRAEPRNKPPLLVFEGFRGKPTVVNNVETYSWVPSILLHGGEWYRDQGTRGCSGLRFVSISGDVLKPGVYEVPFGQTVGELVYRDGGGHGGRAAFESGGHERPLGRFSAGELPDGDAAEGIRGGPGLSRHSDGGRHDVRLARFAAGFRHHEAVSAI